MRLMRGQALVETAVVLPLLLFTFLGFTEAAFLYAQRHAAQVSADVLADVVAERMGTMPGDSWNAGWQTLTTDELNRAGCDGVASVEEKSDSRVSVTLTCRYTPVATNGLWPGLVYTVEGESVVRAPAPSPEP